MTYWSIWYEQTLATHVPKRRLERIERARRQSAVVSEELARVAESGLSDTEACEAVAATIRDHPHETRHALKYARAFKAADDSYLTDRAVRIMQAAVAGAPVGGPPAKWSGLYARQCELGRMPLGDAHKVLCELVPEFAGLTPRAEAIVAAPERKREQMLQLMSEVKRGMLGPMAAGHPDELVRSTIAYMVGLTSLMTVAGMPGARDVSRPAWE